MRLVQSQADQVSAFYREGPGRFDDERSGRRIEIDQGYVAETLDDADRSCKPRVRIVRALSALGDVPVLPTQAGHDAGVLSAKVPTAMLFVRNPTGVSHSPDEYAEIADCRRGAEALADVMADWVAG